MSPNDHIDASDFSDATPAQGVREFVSAPASAPPQTGTHLRERDADVSALWRAVAAQPHAYDLFALLRRIETLHPQLPRLGRARRPSHEPLRIGQEPSSVFAPATVSRLQHDDGSAFPRLHIYSFGLFGPNGPLPLVLTEYTHERAIHHGDRTLVEFANLFHHRLSLLFYRAWADTQSSASLDRADDDAFTRHCSSLITYGLPSLAARDSVSDHARLNHSGHLVRQTRNAEGLARILANYFTTTVAVEELVAGWMPIPDDQCTRLGAHTGAQLGLDAVAGKAVRDRQHRFRLRLGPMSRTAYEHLLPIGGRHRQLLDWVRSYIGIELDWDVRLVLAGSDVPRTRLGSDTRLGWTSWMSTDLVSRMREDLVVDPERIARRLPVRTREHRHVDA